MILSDPITLRMWRTYEAANRRAHEEYVRCYAVVATEADEAAALLWRRERVQAWRERWAS